jgi:hypothetical protein
MNIKIKMKQQYQVTKHNFMLENMEDKGMREQIRKMTCGISVTERESSSHLEMECA